uniref:Uncharacterized protein n=1 Tax=Pyramimonas orientalis virus TaxID=455367 RepID=A0A7M3UP49_POV01|nr:hypothetical protein HWQ62_00377 [Pyramimonas orientalis virus]
MTSVEIANFLSHVDYYTINKSRHCEHIKVIKKIKQSKSKKSIPLQTVVRSQETN